MSAYYPTQGSAYGVQQPVVYAGSNAAYNAGYAQTGPYLAPQPEVVVVPSQGSHHSHHSHHSRHSRSGSRHDHHRHHHHHSSSHDPVVVAAPPVMQPGYPAGYGGYGTGTYGPTYYDLTFGERLRRFFGLAPRGPFKYRHDHGTWGFMGYSRRQRYSDARTGAEVDRKGRPIYRV